VSYKRQELLTIREHLGLPPVFGGIRVGHLFMYNVFIFFFGGGFIVLFAFVCFCFCLRPVSCVSGLSILDCPFGFL